MNQPAHHTSSSRLIVVSACTMMALITTASAATLAPRAPLLAEDMAPDTPSGPSAHIFASAGRSPAAPKEWLDKWTRQPATLAWTDQALNQIVKYQQNPLRSARALGYLHAAMHDAYLLSSRRELSEQARRIAVHSAAASILEYLYPQEPEGRFGAMGRAAAVSESTRAPNASASSLAAAWLIGQQVAQAAKKRASRDGAAERWDIKNRPPEKPGQWQAAPPLNAYRPAEPLAGQWRTWLLKNGAEFAAPPPTAYGSPEYWQEAREVLEVSQQLTPEQKKIADEWNLGLGTVTPAGVWNLRARDLAVQKKLSTAETAALFGVLNAAMADAFIACWHVKFIYWTERPVTAIQAKLQADFLPHLVTPPFPSYLSGHSTVSAAAAEVLATFFPSEAGQMRALAQEAAISRLYGGIHFRSDNEQGLALGRRVGRAVVERLASS